jgi:hypothetical protein
MKTSGMLLSAVLIGALLAPAAFALHESSTLKKTTVSSARYYGTALGAQYSAQKISRGERIYQLTKERLAQKAKREHKNQFRYITAMTKPKPAPNIPLPAPAPAS